MGQVRTKARIAKWVILGVVFMVAAIALVYWLFATSVSGFYYN